MGALGADAAEEGEDEGNGEGSRAEDEAAGAKELAGVGLEGNGLVPCGLLPLGVCRPVRLYGMVLCRT